MTRLIDADVAYKILESCEIRKATIGNPLTDWEYGYTCGIERAESEIECAPTVDAEPVIRCRDCKFSKAYYHGPESNLGMFTYLCTQGPYVVNADDYCSRAERKDNETD